MLEALQSVRRPVTSALTGCRASGFRRTEDERFFLPSAHVTAGEQPVNRSRRAIGGVPCPRTLDAVLREPQRADIVAASPGETSHGAAVAASSVDPRDNPRGGARTAAAHRARAARQV